jgi:hypothetical protein
MGEAKRRKEYLERNPEATPRPPTPRPESVDDSGTQVARSAVRSHKRAVKFTVDLLNELRSKRELPPKPRKNMTEDELKAWKKGRNRKRKTRQKTESAKLGNKKPAKNTCRRCRLAEKHPERP